MLKGEQGAAVGHLEHLDQLGQMVQRWLRGKMGRGHYAPCWLSNEGESFCFTSVDCARRHGTWVGSDGLRREQGEGEGERNVCDPCLAFCFAGGK